MSVLVVGDVVTDVVAILTAPLAVGSDTPARIRFTGGGTAANTAAWLACAGVPVTLAAAVGADAAGEARLAELTAAGVRLAVRRCPDAPTGTVVVLVESGEERSMLSDRGANLLLTPSDVDAALELGPPHAHLHLSGYTLLDEPSRPAGRHALGAARARGMTTSVDAGSAASLRRTGGFLDWVRGVDVLFANIDEAHALAEPAGLARGDATSDTARSDARGDTTSDTARSDARNDAAGLAAALAAAGQCAAVVKNGREGAVCAPRSGPVVAVPAEPVMAVDSTGAGDAFAAGFLSAWLCGADPQVALRSGARLGARAVAAVGARP